jgi:hypothetical protein
MRRVIGIDIRRTFGKVVIWERGVLRHAGRVDRTRTALEGFGKTLKATDEVAIEATGDAMAAARALSPFLARVAIANPRAEWIRIDRKLKSTDVIDVLSDPTILRGVPGHGRAAGDEDDAGLEPEGKVIPPVRATRFSLEDSRGANPEGSLSCARSVAAPEGRHA